MDKNEAVFLSLIKKSLFGIDVTFDGETDWQAVLSEAAAQTVIALAAAAVPAVESNNWQVPAAQSTAHYMRLLFEQTNLIKLFDDNNIPLVIIKGAAAAVYYKKPQLRTMGDVDFCVPPQHIDAARALMDENGYVFECEYEDGREFSYKKGGVIFELHRRYSDKEFDIEPIIADGMKTPVMRTVNGHTFPTLPDYPNGLILLDHIRHHLYGGLGLRQVIDWAVFADSILTDENYKEHFLPLIENIGLVTFCKTVTKTCKMYLGLPDTLTWCDDADADTAAELMESILKKGNFGRKDPYVYKPASEFAAGVKKKGVLRALQDAGVANFPLCRKYGFFRIFAWLFQAFRFMIRGVAALLRGENLTGDIKKGSENAEFYKKLGL